MAVLPGMPGHAARWLEAQRVGFNRLPPFYRPPWTKMITTAYAYYFKKVMQGPITDEN